MNRDSHGEALRQFAITVASPVLQNSNDLSDALYAMSELDIWPDGVDSVSEEQAIRCWKLIERLRAERLPSHLKV